VVAFFGGQYSWTKDRLGDVLSFWANRRNRVLAVLSSILLILSITSGVLYSQGWRLTTWPPTNHFVCEGAVDAPAGTAKQPDTCPGWVWGPWTLEKPRADRHGYDQVLLFYFWQPYWGFMFPDDPLGFFYPNDRNKN
jgi:hypothetical protein